jgi:hypothetical protein
VSAPLRPARLCGVPQTGPALRSGDQSRQHLAQTCAVAGLAAAVGPVRQAEAGIAEVHLALWQGR